MNKEKKSKFLAGIILGLIVLSAFAVRFYNFHDWQYFKMDQGRDAQLVSHAINEGPGMLPLLGPRAGATDVDNGFLRLGPAYYYFQYISGVIFDSTDPKIFAYPDLFFSILAIIALYFFSHLYFSRNLSLLITVMYAFSFIVIEYSRFAWNPNPLQFFTLLVFFALLKFLNEVNERKKLGWLAVWTLSLAIGSQLHFFGFFVLTISSGLLILFHSQSWKKENFQTFLSAGFLKKMLLRAVVFLAVFSFIYTPVIVSDVMTKGENSKNFIQALSSKPSDKPLFSKIEKNITENTKYYCLITTSNCNVGKLKESAPSVIFTAILLIFGLVLCVRAFRKESDLIRKDFLITIFILIGVFFVMTIPVSFDLRPRFFILVFAVPFILAGVIFDFFQEKWPQKSIYFIAILFAVIFGFNLVGIMEWFGEQKNSQIKNVEIERTLILKNKDGVTRGQLQKVVDFMYRSRKNNNEIHYYVKPEHVQPIKYLFMQINDSELKYETLGSKPTENPDAQFFVVIPSDSKLSSMENKFGNKFKEVASEKSGQISVYEIFFEDRKTINELRINKKFKKTDRLFWKDVFGGNGSGINIDDQSTDDIDMNE